MTTAMTSDHKTGRILRIAQMTSGHEAHDTRIVTKQCGALAAAGHEVFLVCRAPEGAANTPDGVTLVPLPRPTGRFSRFWRTARDVRRAAEALDPDIYHFHDPELLPHGIALARRGAAVVYDVHEDYRASLRNRAWIPAPLRRILSFGIAWLERRMERLGWVAAATPDIEGHFTPARTALIQNFPSLTEFDSQPAADPTVRPARLIYVGAVTEERGITDILTALPGLAKDHPGLTFDLVGPIDAALLAQMQTMPGWQYTQIHGRQPRAEVVRLLACAQIGICALRDLPRYRVSQPTKLYEYMAAGLPVLASDFPFWKDLVGDGIGAYVAPGPEGITAGLHALLAAPERAAEIGAQNSARVTKFSWEADFEKLLALYDRALADHKASGRE
ncbi:glycosyltransferase [Roseovarius spongiae]|uniref:Glycosyltransferase n=1 Tax=Roseovarius spongiae TaxID=2320272 RepID=A0A3A8AQ78_9RHOB|nr:glycosyltransferase family 4 protein [Roseovarius spongiae]RKF12422.1 glycosyltransferase [Roseovarius spongiae]